MSRTGDTTQRDDESVDRSARKRLWLLFVFPQILTPIAIDHGLTVGRSNSARVCLEGDGISRRHLEFYRQGPIFAVRDLDSKNGSFLDGKEVQHAAVAAGSVLRIGDHVGVFVEQAEEPSRFGLVADGLLGGQELRQSIQPLVRAATTGISVVIVGATGTGKERVAGALHRLSGRKGRLQPVNCAALPNELAEAELFGHRKGAFTGADRAGMGHFRAADGGTLFLDEIAELPLSVQSKLLRVIEEQTVTPLGETDAIGIDVRLVVATQRPLEELVVAKLFREDLLSRLAGLTVKLPTLSERRADIAPLFEHFVRRYSGGRSPYVEARLIESLCLEEWPRNVRQLEQLSRELLAVHGLEPILKRAFLPGRQGSASESRRQPVSRLSVRRDYDLHQLAHALVATGGNVSTAAASLGFSRQRAYRLMAGKTASELVAQFADRDDSKGGSA